MLMTLAFVCAPVRATNQNPVTSPTTSAANEGTPARHTLPAPTLPKDLPRMRVGVFDYPPYAIQVGQGEWGGIAVTLFREVAMRLEMPFDFVEFPSLLEAYKALGEHNIDFLAVGVIPTPDRQAVMAFSHAFEQSGTSVAVRLEQSPTVFEMLKQLSASRLPVILFWTVCCMLGVALLMSLLERRNNPHHFGGSIHKSFGESLWWSVTTMTTVGYGDRVPITRLGRALGGIWMLIAFALMSVLAGLIASELTVGRMRPSIQTLVDIRHVASGAVADSAAAMDAEQQSLHPQTFPTLAAALEALNNHTVDAILGDTEALQYEVQELYPSRLFVLPQPLVIEYICLGLSQNLKPSVTTPFNYWVLRIIESPSWQSYRRGILGDK